MKMINIYYYTQVFQLLDSSKCSTSTSDFPFPRFFPLRTHRKRAARRTLETVARIVSQQFNKNPLGPFRRESSSFLERIDVPSVRNPLVFSTSNPPQGRETMKNRKGIAVEA